MKRFAVLLLALAISMAAFSCSDNPVENEEEITPEDRDKADSIAANWFQALADTMGGMEDKDADAVRATSFAAIRGGFMESLDLNPANPTAHLGIGILEVLEINYSDDLWEVIDSMNAWGGGLGARAAGDPDRHHALIGRQFALLAEVPFGVLREQSLAVPPNLTIAHIQGIIKSTVIPALTRALNHLGSVESNTGASVTIVIEDEGAIDTLIIDLGEICLFDASLRAARAAFRLGIAYDCDLFGPDGTYGWIEDMNNLVDYPCPGYRIIEAGVSDTLCLVYRSGERSSLEDSITTAVAHYNLAERDEFLTLRESGTVLAGAHEDLLGTISKLEASIDFIKHHREHETEHNIVKLADLTDLESGLGDPEGPNFAQGFETIEDVLDWIRSFMSGPITFTENLGPDELPFTWAMNLRALFTPPITDWKTLLPYHRWDIPAGAWIDRYEFAAGGNWNVQNPLWLYVYRDGACLGTDFYNISYIKYFTVDYELVPGILVPLDGPQGNPVDLEVERVPYFPDYTLHGLFPDMTRQRWLDLVEILDPSGGR